MTLKGFFCNREDYNDCINYSLEYTACIGKLDIFKYILTNYSDEITQESISLSLVNTSRYGKINIVKYLLKYYRNNMTDYVIMKSLDHAQLHYYSNVIKYIKTYQLIRKNSNIMYKNTIVLG